MKINNNIIPFFCPRKFRDKLNGDRCERNFGVVTLKGEHYGGSNDKATKCDTKLNNAVNESREEKYFQNAEKKVEANSVDVLSVQAKAFLNLSFKGNCSEVTKSPDITGNINIQNVELQLSKIFEDEVNSDNPVVLSYKPQVIPKMAKFLSGEMKRSASVGIAGETASGKSTITHEIIDSIEAFAKAHNCGNVITRINTDDYYYDRSEEVKKAGGMAEFVKHYDLDVPEALELDLMSRHIQSLLAGKSVMLPKYDMSGTAIRHDNYTLAKPSNIIVSEGLFTLTEKVRDAFDFKIYVDVDNEVQKKRFFIRADERGLGGSANSIYDNASEKAKIYIRPCKEIADIVISGEAPKNDYKTFVNKILSVAEQLHYSKGF